MTDGHEAFSARDLAYMAMALEEARGAAEAGDVPVGAVLVRATPSGDAVLAIGRNTRERDHTALGHAEINAIGDACRACGAWRLADCTLYVTLEPCPMCAGAILGARAAYIGGCAGTACTISDQRVRWVASGQSTAIPRPCKPSLSNTDAAKRNAGRCCATFSVRVADPERTRTDQPERKRKALPPRI